MKVVTLQQLEQDLDRLLDGVIEEGEHFRVSVSWITCADTIDELIMYSLSLGLISVNISKIISSHCFFIRTFSNNSFTFGLRS